MVLSYHKGFKMKNKKKEFIPPKELLTIVAKLSERTVLLPIKIDNDYLFFEILQKDVKTNREVHFNSSDINIYELCFKCKEWCAEKGYQIIEYISVVDVIDRKSGKKLHSEVSSNIEYNYKNVLLATQWVINENS